MKVRFYCKQQRHGAISWDVKFDDLIHRWVYIAPIRIINPSTHFSCFVHLQWMSYPNICMNSASAFQFLHTTSSIRLSDLFTVQSAFCSVLYDAFILHRSLFECLLRAMWCHENQPDGVIWDAFQGFVYGCWAGRLIQFLWNTKRREAKSCSPTAGLSFECAVRNDGSSSSWWFLWCFN